MLLKKMYIILRTKILKIKYLILLTQLLILLLNAKINQVKNEIPSITNLATTAALNAKISEAKNITPNIGNLATTTTDLTAVEYEIPDRSKYITSPSFNKLTAEHFTVRLKQASLAIKGDIVDFVKRTDFDDKLKNSNKKVTSNKLQHVLVENELRKLQDEIEKLHGAQLYLIF